MSTISKSASLRLFRMSCTHFATAAAFRPGRVLPTMIPIFSIFHFLPSDAVQVDLSFRPTLGSFPSLVFAALDLSRFLIEFFRCEQPQLLKRSVELFHLLFGQG